MPTRIFSKSGRSEAGRGWPRSNLPGLGQGGSGHRRAKKEGLRSPSFLLTPRGDLRAALIAVEGSFVVGVVGEEAGRVAAAGLAALPLGDEGGAAIVLGL